MISLLGVSICIVFYSLLMFVFGTTITVAVFAFHCVVIPLVFRYSKTLRRSIVFGNIGRSLANIDFDEPSACGINGGRNLSIEYYSKVDNCETKIGLWHILPKSSYDNLKDMFNEGSDKEARDTMMHQELIGSKKPIMLYCHGNSNSRAAHHRILLYNFFQTNDFHTICFDYRGYGDSADVPPTEDGVVEDALVVYDWLQTILGEGPDKPRVYVWGHSLGTAIASHFLGNLKELSKRLLEKDSVVFPAGLILECPFSNLADEFGYHQLTIVMTWLPYWRWAFVSPFEECAVHAFHSDRHLARAPGLPILILHAKDDFIVPFVVGKMLYDHVKRSRTESDAEVTLHAFESDLGLGHKHICNAENLHQIVGEFVKRCN